MFAHIVVFISFIYAIAITHPLASSHALIVERERVRWSPLLICWMTSSVLLLIMNWLVIFRLSSIVTWSTAQILIHILGAFCLYFVCAFPAMRTPEHGPIDMPAYFARNRVPILGAFLLFGFVAIAVNLVDHYANAAATGIPDRVYRILPNMIATTVGLIFRVVWMQWLVALFVLGRLIYVLSIQVAGG